jgi:two-component system, LytTR family, response regulator
MIMKEQLTAILVDDEISTLENLQLKLQEFCPDVKIIATAETPEKAIELIQLYKPDVIFLDIEMPRMNGLRMLDELKQYKGEIIFTTAYAHYAIDAIRINAFDYLLKPVSIADLQNAVSRLLEKKLPETVEKMEILRKSLADIRSSEDKIAVPTSEGLQFLQINDIIHIESSSNYSKIIFKNGQTMLVTKLLKDFEDILAPYRFYRVHHSHLINLNCIAKYIRGQGGQVILQNGQSIDVSRRKKEEFLKLISQ